MTSNLCLSSLTTATEEYKQIHVTYLPREVVDAKSIKTFKERLEANWEHKKTTF